MSIKVIVPLSVTITAGYGIGCVPDLHDFLHLSILMVVPIGGVIYAMFSCVIVFVSCYFLNIKVSRWSWLFMAVFIMFGYTVADFGSYRTGLVPVVGVQGYSDGDYQAAELMSFFEYMKLQLGSSVIQSRSGGHTLELGSTGTTVTYLVNIGAAFLGSLAMLAVLADMYPFCSRCFIYKKLEKKYELFWLGNIKTFDEILAQINFLIENKDYRGLSMIIPKTARVQQYIKEKDALFQISVDQRYCALCREATILGDVFIRENGQWELSNSRKFTFSSQQGEHVTSNIY